MPFFRDSRGVLCAMAYLIARSGRVDLVDRIAAQQNNAFIAEPAGDKTGALARQRWTHRRGSSADSAELWQRTRFEGQHWIRRRIAGTGRGRRSRVRFQYFLADNRQRLDWRGGRRRGGNSGAAHMAESDGSGDRARRHAGRRDLRGARDSWDRCGWSRTQARDNKSVRRHPRNRARNDAYLHLTAGHPGFGLLLQARF